MINEPPPESCCLNTSFRACCCTCKHRIKDFHHCTTTGQCGDKSFKLPLESGSECTCAQPRGYICVAGLSHGDSGRVHSGWCEHGLCEQHSPLDEPRRGAQADDVEPRSLISIPEEA